MIHSKFHSIILNNGQEKGTETSLLAKKMGKRIQVEVLLYLYKQCKHHTKYAFSDINGLIFEI